MNEQTQRQLANLQRAHDFLAQVPETKINLEFFVEECGTIFCAAGHLTREPHFAQFMSLKRNKRHDYLCLTHPDPQHPQGDPQTACDCDWSYLDEHFGPRAFDRLFRAWSEGGFDRELGAVSAWEDPDTASKTIAPNDKELALARLRRQMQELREANA